MNSVSIADYRSYIEAALEHAGGSHTYADVCDGVSRGSLQFWPGPDGSYLLTELVQYPQYLSIRCFLAGGSLDGVEALAPIAEQWAREQGCTHAEFIGRKGWERSFLTRSGWKVVEQVRLQKAL